MSQTNRTELLGEVKEMEAIRRHVNFKSSGAPGSWRCLPELPTAEELNPDWDNPDEVAAIVDRAKVNDVRQPYKSSEEYLEIQYLLQREDGLTQLRYAIKRFKSDFITGDDDISSVYSKVFVKAYNMTKLGPIAMVEFATEKRVKWTHTRRLTPGTLVALSTARDRFRTICKPAIIADRSLKNLEMKPPVVQLLWAQLEDAVFDPNQELVMIEARKGFYEAVRHCLIGLQHVAEHDNPIEKHLVFGGYNNAVPAYVAENPNMNLLPLIHHEPKEPRECERLRRLYQSHNILSGIPDDVRAHTSLDNSQLDAVHRMLTTELSIVQGPPGTGKTFTSVQALRVQLACLGRHSVAGPKIIVVAAETNHAVDQILLQLTKSGYQILRLGSRTKNDEIRQYSMYNLRKVTRPAMSKRFQREMSQHEVARKITIHEFRKKLEEVVPAGLIEPEVLRHHGLITEEQYLSLRDDEDWCAQPSTNGLSGVMSEWLGESLMDISIREYHDPATDAEIIEDTEIDEREFDLDLDDAVVDVDDEMRLVGEVIALPRKWTGCDPHHYVETDLMLKREMNKADLWQVTQRFRGALYNYWKRELLRRGIPTLLEILDTFEDNNKGLKMARWYSDTQIVNSSKVQVVGCTTTGLTKYRGFIEALQPHSVLIEEAAQSREATITAALYKGLQQLVLVGDHQQLVPSCDTEQLGRWPYNLRVSMFQRLVEYMGMPYTVLNMQRRMIPGIRALLSPFYPQLRDHAVVQEVANRPPIPGMHVPSYLFHHEWPEGMDSETLSKFNLTEAEMIVHFIDYLLRNGTKTSQITVLTFYRGQRKLIMKLGRKMLGHLGEAHINVHTVDSYQGEENDIILLSLVRSSQANTRARVGFVQDKNRGVVSISRARRGFYVFGNILNLENAGAESAYTWGNVRAAFEAQNQFHPSRGLPILCCTHKTISYIANPDEWVGNHGGCDLPCGQKFPGCGHACNRKCHPMSHDKLICQEPCERRVHCGHNCVEVCGESCSCFCVTFRTVQLLSHQRQQDEVAANARSSTLFKRPAQTGRGGHRGNYRGGHYGRKDGRGGPASPAAGNRATHVLTAATPKINRWMDHNISADERGIGMDRQTRRKPKDLLIDVRSDGEAHGAAHMNSTVDIYRPVFVDSQGKRRYYKTAEMPGSRRSSTEGCHPPAGTNDNFLSGPPSGLQEPLRFSSSSTEPSLSPGSSVGTVDQDATPDSPRSEAKASTGGPEASSAESKPTLVAPSTLVRARILYSDSAPTRSARHEPPQGSDYATAHHEPSVAEWESESVEDGMAVSGSCLRELHDMVLMDVRDDNDLIQF